MALLNATLLRFSRILDIVLPLFFHLLEEKTSTIYKKHICTPLSMKNYYCSNKISQMFWSKSRRCYIRFQQFEVIQIFQFYKLQDFTILVLTPKQEKGYNEEPYTFFDQILGNQYQNKDSMDPIDQPHTSVDMNIAKHCHINFRFFLLFWKKRRRSLISKCRKQSTRNTYYCRKLNFSVLSNNKVMP